MDIRHELQEFLRRYQTTGWLLLLMGGGLLLQGLLFLIFRLADAPEVYALVIRKLVLPYELMDLLTQPWSILTYPFFSPGFDILRFLVNGLIIFAFGRIHQQLLGDQRTRRLTIFAVPVIGLLTVLIAAPFTYSASDRTEVLAEAYQQQQTQATELQIEEVPGTSGTGESSSSAPEAKPLPKANPQGMRVFNDRLLYSSGMIALIIVLVVSSITLVPDYPIQLFLFGQVKIVWVGIVLVAIELIWANFFTPLAISIWLGAALGFMHIYLLRQGTDLTETIWSYYQDSDKNPRMTVKHGAKPPREKVIRSSGKSERKGKSKSDISQEIIDDILDKISEKGYESLSREEKELLFKASTQQKDDE
jgi:hypothetical protein